MGDEIFEALLKTGWDVKIGKDGRITAKRDSTQVVGQVEQHGRVIAWPSFDLVEQVLFEARIVELRDRAEQAKKYKVSTEA